MSTGVVLGNEGASCGSHGATSARTVEIVCHDKRSEEKEVVLCSVSTITDPRCLNRGVEICVSRLPTGRLLLVICYVPWGGSSCFDDRFLNVRLLKKYSGDYRSLRSGDRYHDLIFQCQDKDGVERHLSEFDPCIFLPKPQIPQMARKLEKEKNLLSKRYRALVAKVLSRLKDE
jgi:hypothetical protein